MEESDDLHADAMRGTRAALDDVVERGRDLRALGLMTAVGAGAVALSATGAGADTPADIAAAQTAASIENLAVKVYGVAAGLPFMKNIPDPAGATVVAFVTKTVQQHTEHAAAFNAAATKLGGKEQTGPDMVVYNSVVVPALPKLKTPKDVVDFAATLELVAAETYATQTAAVADAMLRGTFASIMGVENQHRAILLAVSALLAANAPQLIKLGGALGQLPAAAGSVGFPDSFLPLDAARPATEGAVA